MSDKALNLEGAKLTPVPTLRNITNTASPVRSHNRPGSSGFSPIRRSGSPMRRKQIQEIEDAYKAQHAKRVVHEPPEAPAAKRSKSVTFDSDIQVFEEQTSSPYRDTKPTLQQSVDHLAVEVSEIKSTQTILVKKLDYLITLLDDQKR